MVYEHMSEADRQKLDADITKVLTENIKSVEGLLAKEVERATTALYHHLICNPWGDVIRENSGSCEFINRIQDHVWKLMMEQNPNTPSKYCLHDLIEEWRKRLPEEFKGVVGADVAEQLEKLQERLDFEIKCGRRNY